MNPSTTFLTGLFFAVAAGLFSSGVNAQNLTDRGGKWEASLQLHSVESESFSSDRGSQADVDGSIGWGFGIGYNFNDHWALSLDSNYREADYTATTTPDAGNPNPPSRFSGDLDVSTTQLNATYNFLPKALTPFITAGLGATWVNTDIPDGSPVSVCWWDPWWGYYCGPVVPTKSDTYFSYTVVQQIRLAPFGLKDVTRLAVATIVPLLPLTLTIFSPDELLTQLVKVLF